jgi:hypothetical protein
MSMLRYVLVTTLFGSAVSCTVGDEEIVEADSDADSNDGSQMDDIVALMNSDGDSSLTLQATATADRDRDGIPDATEELLLRRYRPYYRFSQDGGTDESFRPANPVAELTNAQLKSLDLGGTGASDPIAGCGRADDHHLDPPDSLYSCRADTSLLVSKVKSNYCLNLDNTRYHGVSFADAKANATGLYGHVAPTTIDGHAAYHIEYWQFFAFNNQDISVLGLGSFGDHEGDWTSVQLWFDRELHRLVKVRYLLHGKSAEFTMPALSPTCRDCMIDVKGPHFDPNPPNFFDDVAAYSDNQAEFYIDDHRFKHVVLYIERGGHEGWPGAWGHAQQSVGPFTIKLNPHNGSGPSYLVPNVNDRLFNMGEVDHPLTPAARLILWFDGFWGCTNSKEGVVVGAQRRSPVGPALHCSWQWPDRGPLAGCEH